MDQNQYNKLCIFDLDGVLIDSRELHFDALNMAIQKVVGESFCITIEQHLATYDGLPTKKKLKLLTEKKGLLPESYDAIWQAKQDFTSLLLDNIFIDTKLIDICVWLRNRGYKIAVASNAINATVQKTIGKLGISKYIDCIQTNENTKHSKPYPMMYWNCMELCYAIPRTTLIVEDSHIGRAGAVNSGATLLAVENRKDLTLNKIQAAIEKLENNREITIPWKDSKLNVIIPMAGAGSRFAKLGYSFPKPLIEVRGKPMIQVVVESLNIEANYIYIVQKEHYEKYQLQYLLNLITPNCKIIQIEGVTEGAACTVLLAQEHINNDKPLLIANSDQFIKWDANEVMYAFAADKIDGGVLIFEGTHPKWSYVKLDKNGFVNEIVEKKVISNLATVGIYYWSKGSDFIKYANQMIAADKRVNGEFYVAPVYQEAIDDGKLFRVKRVDQMWSLGTPEDLNYYLENYKK